MESEDFDDDPKMYATWRDDERPQAICFHQLKRERVQWAKDSSGRRPFFLRATGGGIGDYFVDSISQGIPSTFNLAIDIVEVSSSHLITNHANFASAAFFFFNNNPLSFPPRLHEAAITGHILRAASAFEQGH